MWVLVLGVDRVDVRVGCWVLGVVLVAVVV